MCRKFLTWILLLLFVIVCAGHEIQLRRMHNTRSVVLKSNDVDLTGGEEFGALFADISLGTPPQTFTVHVDTGSSSLVIYDVGCSQPEGRSCSEIGYDSSESTSYSSIQCPTAVTNSREFYLRSFSAATVRSDSVCASNCGSDEDAVKQTLQTDSSSSSSSSGSSSDNSADEGAVGVSSVTVRSAGCPFTVYYADSTQASGVMVRDTMTLGSLTAAVSFGSLTLASADFEPDGVHGILGLAYPSAGVRGLPSPIDTLLSAASLPALFSVCLSDTGGILTLGAEGQHHEGDFIYSPVILQQYYQLQVVSVRLGGAVLGTRSELGGALVDTGTTQLLLPPRVFSAFAAALRQDCSLPGVCSSPSLLEGYCVDLQLSDLNRFPDLAIALDGLTLTLPPSSYLRPYHSDSSSDNGVSALRCLSVAAATDVVTVLGDTVLRQYEVVFDRVRHRVGFAAVSECAAGSDLGVHSVAPTQSPLAGGVLVTITLGEQLSVMSDVKRVTLAGVLAEPVSLRNDTGVTVLVVRSGACQNDTRGPVVVTVSHGTVYRSTTLFIYSDSSTTDEIVALVVAITVTVIVLILLGVALYALRERLCCCVQLVCPCCRCQRCCRLSGSTTDFSGDYERVAVEAADV